MSTRLAGKTAVVVGAGQTQGETVGNGRATAVVFAREGARLVLADRDVEAVQATADLIHAEVGVVPAVCRTDVTVEDDCERLAATALEVLGRVDVLHNNVGIVGEFVSSVDLTLAPWKQVIDVNLTGMWLVCKHIIPAMRAQGTGAIVNISSMASLMQGTGTSPYTLSKVGVNALTTGLALENAPFGIRVNAILPGLIDTPMGVDAKARDRGVSRQVVAGERHAQVPLGKMGTAWDIAAAALFLASDEARFITGALLPVDGGQTLRCG